MDKVNVHNGNNFHWNWTEFCGAKNFSIWTPNGSGDLSRCFQTLCLQIPVLSVIAIISSYYCGKVDRRRPVRSYYETIIIRIRQFIVLLLAVAPSVKLVLLLIAFDNAKSIPIVEYWLVFLEVLTWFIHFCYLSTLLRNRVDFGLRCPIVLGSLLALLYAATIVDFRSAYWTYQLANIFPPVVSIDYAFIFLVFCGLSLLLQTVYGLTLIPSGQTYPNYEDGQDDTMSSSLLPYDRFREDFDPYYLGVAGENCGRVSKLVFWWVNPLVHKGYKGKLKIADDLFDLPDSLTTSTLHGRLRTTLTMLMSVNHSTGLSLLKILHKRFGLEFYAVGVLKFLADVAGLITPLLLHQLIEFIEDQQIPVLNGYFYGCGIFLASFIGSFCTMHFDFIAGNINLKMQGSLISHIYRKIFRLSPQVYQEIGVGEIVNHISVDMERISSSCISFHAVWSIPFQLIITLYLLYTQIGVAFIAGVLFSVILIPINRKIASKIGSFSTRMLSEKDERVQLMSEILKGIRVIKLYAWEEYFMSRILRTRHDELKYLKYRKYLDALCVYFWATTPVIISVLTFMFYIFLGGKLRASIVFTSLALLNMLIGPLNAFPWVLNGIVEAWVSLKRVDSFLQSEEQELDYSRDDQSKSQNHNHVCVSIEYGSFSWTGDGLNLSEINISIQKGHLVGICGPVGCGKSSLLAAMLGEIRKMDGRVYIDPNESVNGIGYVAQSAWIQRCSIRENILFGKVYDVVRYKTVVEACALFDDFKTWPHGDLEMVGEGGTTLSGGQKARVALARAVYQNVDLYLLDDILSAVDAHVARHIYEKCVRGLLEGKTRVFVTHATKWFASADWLIVLENGRIVNQGRPDEVQSEARNEEEVSSENDDDAKSNDELAHDEKIYDENCDENQLENENTATGSVSTRVYAAYLKCVGYALACFILFLVAGMQISRLGVDWWLSIWLASSNSTTTSTNVPEFFYLSVTEQQLTQNYASDANSFLRIYFAIGVINSIVAMGRAFFFAYGGIRAATFVHRKLLRSIFSATMEFFEVSPLGRILNRFSSDTNTVDDALPFDINILLAQLASVFGTLSIAIYGIPWLSLFVAPLLPLYQGLQNHYRSTSRELKRLVSVTLSPLYSHVNETLSGISTIRSLRQSSRFIEENQERVDALQKCNLSSIAASVWLNIRLQMIGLCIIGGVCSIAILQRHLDVAHSVFVGLALSYALTLTANLSSLVNIFVETERKMVAMERIHEYTENVKHEGDSYNIDALLPFAWPSQGMVTFSNVHLKYREDTEYALKDVSFEVHPGEKIGIVGRTGSGKSSLLAALFRLTEICEGNISVDAIRTANISLQKLRSKITIIPQEPFLFCGTIRENVDPFGEHDDFHIWETINKCHLSPLILRLGGMNACLSTSGSNLSIGERQLLCLVRAILRNTKIVCIDEATANIDQKTDEHLQQVIRESFVNSTVFTIAHRVDSVMHCDRILVMDHGKVIEFDSPETLLKNENSYFYKACQ